MKTYEDFVQELQRGTITLSEFVRYTEDEYEAVSYTHLTLPTILLV